MSLSHTFTTARTTEPDRAALLTAVRALDPTAGLALGGLPRGDGSIELFKDTPWTAPQIAAAQTVVDTAPAATPHRTAQSAIDQWPLELKAAFLLVMEQMNVVRAALPTPLPPFTAAQFLTAIKAKAGTL